MDEQRLKSFLASARETLIQAKTDALTRSDGNEYVSGKAMEILREARDLPYTPSCDPMKLVQDLVAEVAPKA